MILLYKRLLYKRSLVYNQLSYKRFPVYSVWVFCHKHKHELSKTTLSIFLLDDSSRLLCCSVHLTSFMAFLSPSLWAGHGPFAQCVHDGVGVWGWKDLAFDLASSIHLLWMGGGVLWSIVPLNLTLIALSVFIEGLTSVCSRDDDSTNDAYSSTNPGRMQLWKRDIVAAVKTLSISK